MWQFFDYPSASDARMEDMGKLIIRLQNDLYLTQNKTKWSKKIYSSYYIWCMKDWLELLIAFHVNPNHVHH